MYNLRIDEYHGKDKTILWIYKDDIRKWWIAPYHTGTRAFSQKDQPLILELLYTSYKTTNDVLIKNICFKGIQDLCYNKDYVEGFEHNGKLIL